MKTKKEKCNSTIPLKSSTRRKNHGTIDSGSFCKRVKMAAKSAVVPISPPPEGDTSSELNCVNNVGVVEARHPHDQNSNEATENAEDEKHFTAGNLEATSLNYDTPSSVKEKKLSQKVVQEDGLMYVTTGRDAVSDTVIEDITMKVKIDSVELEAQLPVVEIEASDIALAETGVTQDMAYIVLSNNTAVESENSTCLALLQPDVSVINIPNVFGTPGRATVCHHEILSEEARHGFESDSIAYRVSDQPRTDEDPISEEHTNKDTASVRDENFINHDCSGCNFCSQFPLTVQNDHSVQVQHFVAASVDSNRKMHTQLENEFINSTENRNDQHLDQNNKRVVARNRNGNYDIMMSHQIAHESVNHCNINGGPNNNQSLTSFGGLFRNPTADTNQQFDNTLTGVISDIDLYRQSYMQSDEHETETLNAGQVCRKHDYYGTVNQNNATATSNVDMEQLGSYIAGQNTRLDNLPTIIDDENMAAEQIASELVQKYGGSKSHMISTILHSDDNQNFIYSEGFEKPAQRVPKPDEGHWIHDVDLLNTPQMLTPVEDDYPHPHHGPHDQLQFGDPQASSTPDQYRKQLAKTSPSNLQGSVTYNDGHLHGGRWYSQNIAFQHRDAPESPCSKNNAPYRSFMRHSCKQPIYHDRDMQFEPGHRPHTSHLPGMQSWVHDRDQQFETRGKPGIHHPYDRDPEYEQPHKPYSGLSSTMHEYRDEANFEAGHALINFQKRQPVERLNNYMLRQFNLDHSSSQIRPYPVETPLNESSRGSYSCNSRPSLSTAGDFRPVAGINEITKMTFTPREMMESHLNESNILKKQRPLGHVPDAEYSSIYPSRKFIEKMAGGNYRSSPSFEDDYKESPQPKKRSRISKYNTDDVPKVPPQLPLFDDMMAKYPQILKREDVMGTKQKYFVVNPSDVTNMPSKTLLTKYIDFLILENEQITEISKSVNPPVDIYVTEDMYFMDTLKLKVPFPSRKFMEWVSSFYPKLNFRAMKFKGKHPDIHAADIVLAADLRPTQQILEDTFYFFQRAAMNMEA